MSVSLLMSVYSGETPENLDSCLQSIKSQTRPADETVLVIDGPIAPELEAVINRYMREIKIVTVSLKSNVGLASALNSGLKHCQSQYVARMDSDDICQPERLELQLEFLTKNPNIDVVGSFVEERSQDLLESYGIKKVPIRHDSILQKAKLANPMNHPTIVAKREVFENLGGYPTIYPEDYILWTRAMRLGYEFANLPHVLVIMRAGSAQTSRRGLKFLRGEVQTFWEMFSHRQITVLEFMVAVFPRVIVRAVPAGLRKKLILLAKRKVHND